MLNADFLLKCESSKLKNMYAYTENFTYIIYILKLMELCKFVFTYTGTVVKNNYLTSFIYISVDAFLHYFVVTI